MRKLTLLFLFSFFLKLSIAQPDIKYWDDDKKQKKEEQNFYHGLLHGKYTEWYKNGQIAKTGYYYLGADSSEAKTFYEDGKVKSFENYWRGKKQGHCTYYYKNGQKAQYAVYKY